MKLVIFGQLQEYQYSFPRLLLEENFVRKESDLSEDRIASNANFWMT